MLTIRMLAAPKARSFQQNLDLAKITIIITLATANGKIGVKGYFKAKLREQRNKMYVTCFWGIHFSPVH